MPTKLRSSITSRYLVIVTSFLALIQLLFGAFQIWSIYQEQLDNLTRKVESRAEFLSSVTAEAVLFNDFLTLETFMQQTAEDVDVVYSVVVNRDEQILTRYLNRNDTLIQNSIEQISEPQVENVIATIGALPNITEIRRPIVSEGVTLGEIWLAYTTQNVRDTLINSILRRLISTTVVIVLLSILTIVLFNWLIRTPLKEVSELAITLAEGDLSERALVTGQTEIDQLKQTFNLMADRLQETLQNLERREAEARQLSHVASNTTNMVVITDAYGCIEWVNNSFTSITGYTLPEVQGQHPGHFLQGKKTDPAAVAYMREKIAQQSGFSVEVYNYTKAGKGYWVLVEAQPVYDDQGKVINFIAIETNITESKVFTQRLESYARELERSNRELQDFAYVASHDLQEPLRKIQAFGSRVSSRYSNQLDERGQDYINRMQNAAARMQELINALLSFSRVAAQKEPFTNVDLQETVAHVLADLELRIEETDAQFDIAVLPVIEADHVQMRQLFQNLLGNALKFIDTKRPPQIQVGYVQNGQMAHITVTDNGIGFDDQYAHKIFEVFQRLHGKYGNYSGTGVGLAICRRIVERHNGQISVSSQENYGTTFTISLPYKQDV